MHKAIIININDDKMAASMSIKKAVLEANPDLSPPELQDILDSLEEKGIIFGIDKNTIQKNLNSREIKVVVARGKKLIQTVQDKITFTYEDMRKKKISPTVLSDDKVNFYDAVQFKLVKENELLVFIKKGRPGTTGTTITGIDLTPQEYKELKVEQLNAHIGPNTKLVPQGIVSTISGIPLISFDNKAFVDETLMVKTDVDFSSGSIEYDGPIIVEGAVTNNFSVKSPKDIIIHGIVDGGIIESGGMVTLLGGLNKGKVSCKSNLIAKYIYLANIKSRGTVIADEAILNSEITAKTIIAKGEQNAAKTGQISGGILKASNYIWAKSIGSASSNYTEIKIVTFIDRTKADKLDKEVNNFNEQLDKVYKTINLIDQLKKKHAQLPPDIKKKQIQLIKTKIALETKLKSLRKELDRTNKLIQLEDYESMRRVFISAALYPKVSINIFEQKFLSRQEYGPSIVEIDKENDIIYVKPSTGKLEIPAEKET